jgi:PAS domain S-box-containing protein
MLGYPDREALIALDASDLYVSAEDRQRWQTLLDREGVVHGFEMQLRRRDGTLIWVRDTARVIPGSDGQTRYYEGSLEDITERKRLEERLRQKDRMAALGRLAGGIAHDFNNILTGITLSAQMLLAERRLPRDLAPDLESVVEDAHRAARLVAQILDFTRGSYFETRPVDMRTFIHGTADVLRRHLPENIQILMELGSGDYIVDANPDRLEQVLVILAANARDAMTSSSSDVGELRLRRAQSSRRAVESSEGGELRIGLSRIDLRPAEEPPVAGMPPLSPPPLAGGIEGGEWVCLSVSDTGVGISPEAMTHLFEPFFTTKGLGQGTGMGLAQMHGIVTQHGGHIRVTTDVGRGTTFYIYLPAYQPHQAAEAS